MLKRSTMFSVRIDFNLIDKLENRVKEGKFKNVSEALRKYIEIGLYVEDLKPQIKDPKFLKSMEDLRREDSIFDWLTDLSDEQVNAVCTASQMERESRIQRSRR